MDQHPRYDGHHPGGPQWERVSNHWPDGSTKIGATLKDETLTMAQPMSGVTFTYVKSSDSLLSQGMMGQVEYKRAK